MPGNHCNYVRASAFFVSGDQCHGFWSTCKQTPLFGLKGGKLDIGDDTHLRPRDHVRWLKNQWRDTKNSTATGESTFSGTPTGRIKLPDRFCKQPPQLHLTSTWMFSPPLMEWYATTHLDLFAGRTQSLLRGPRSAMMPFQRTTKETTRTTL
jgi:hypothetical protein